MVQHPEGEDQRSGAAEPNPAGSSKQPLPLSDAATDERHTKGRSVSAIICIVLAALLTTPAAIAYWGQRTLNDAQRYVATVGPLVNSPAVQDAIATKVTDAKARLVARGLTIVEKIPIPTIDKQIVLLDAPKLKQARTIYAFANPLAKWLIVLVTALYLGALVLSRRRPRMTVIIGVVLGANALLVAWALDVGRQLFIDQLAGTVFGPAASVFYATPLAYLVRGWQVFWWLGVILVATGWFAGSNASGTAVRAWVSGGLETAGAAMADGPVGGAGRWTTANARWLRVVVGVLGTVVLLWGNDVSQSRLFWSLVLVVVLLGIVQILVGAGAKPAPHRVLATNTGAVTGDP